MYEVIILLLQKNEQMNGTSGSHIDEHLTTINVSANWCYDGRNEIRPIAHFITKSTTKNVKKCDDGKIKLENGHSEGSHTILEDLVAEVQKEITPIRKTNGKHISRKHRMIRQPERLSHPSTEIIVNKFVLFLCNYSTLCEIQEKCTANSSNVPTFNAAIICETRATIKFAHTVGIESVNVDI
jgi:hypothetical protein